MPTIPIPTVPQLIFAALAGFTAICGLMVVLSRKLFHSALFLIGSFFGVTGLYVLLEAEFLAVSQVLVYVGAISILIAFAIMLTRGMMARQTVNVNRQVLSVALSAILFFLAVAGIVSNVRWPETYAAFVADQAVIARLGELMVSTYVVAFEVLGLLLLVALVGAVMLARDR